MLVELATKLTDAGLIPSGYTLYRDVMNESTDKAIGLYGTGGFSPSTFLGESSTVEVCGLQVVVRGPKLEADTARGVIEAIYQAVLGWGAFVQDGTRYLTLAAVQSPFLFRRDGNERVLYAVNFVVWKELSPL